MIDDEVVYIAPAPYEETFEPTPVSQWLDDHDPFLLMPSRATYMSKSTEQWLTEANEYCMKVLGIDLEQTEALLWTGKYYGTPFQAKINEYLSLLGRRTIWL